jgi:hypothetical protein
VRAGEARVYGLYRIQFIAARLQEERVRWPITASFNI